MAGDKETGSPGRGGKELPVFYYSIGNVISFMTENISFITFLLIVSGHFPKYTIRNKIT